MGKKRTSRTVRASAAASLLVERLRAETGATAPQIIDRLIVQGIEVEMQRLKAFPADDRGARAMLKAYRNYLTIRFATPL